MCIHAAAFSLMYNFYFQANALYHSLFQDASVTSDGSSLSNESKLLSLKAMLSRQASARQPLSVIKASSEGSDKPLHAVVVASTALHASILHDSEALRASIPDISRFKIAAQQNIERFYEADVEFSPPKDGAITIYDPRTRTFVPFTGDSVNATGHVLLHGPFSYFLSTVNVDRLESQFVISPKQREVKSTDCMLVTIVRPKRDPSYNNNAGKDLESNHRTQFASKLHAVLVAAYDSGKHVELGYDAGGAIASSESADIVSYVVEYVCCGAWRWIPVSSFCGCMLHILIQSLRKTRKLRISA